MRIKLTVTFLKGLKPGPERVTYWDEEDGGLGLEVSPKGTRTWLYKYFRHGKQTKLKLGSYPATTLPQVKARVRHLKGQMEGPERVDPRTIMGNGPDPQTLKALAERFEKEYLPKLAQTTQAKYQNVLKNHILPKLGEILVSQLDEDDVKALHASMSHIKASANYCVEVLSSLMAFGGRKKAKNPCCEVPRYQLPKRQLYLTVEDYQRIEQELQKVEASPCAIRALRLIMLTGARKSEVLEMDWSWVNLEEMTITIPATHHKTGLRVGEKVIHLPQEALELLRATTTGRVFQNASGGRCWAVDEVWREVRGKLGLDRFTIHSLRHSYASLCISNGMTLEEIGPLLGHKEGSRATSRYAHLLQDRQKALSAKAGGLIAGAMKS